MEAPVLSLKIAVVDEDGAELGSVSTTQTELTKAGSNKLPAILCGMVRKLAEVLDRGKDGTGEADGPRTESITV